MKLLLDTNVISELRKDKPYPGVVRTLREAHDRDLFLSALTIGELEAGAERVKSRDPDFADRLDRWISDLVARFGPHILPFQAQTAAIWGRLTARSGRSDADLIIAATAIEHSLTIVTRNVRHFETLGLGVIDPFRD